MSIPHVLAATIRYGDERMNPYFLIVWVRSWSYCALCDLWLCHKIEAWRLFLWHIAYTCRLFGFKGHNREERRTKVVALGRREDNLITHLSLVHAFGIHVNSRSLRHECGYMIDWFHEKGWVLFWVCWNSWGIIRYSIWCDQKVWGITSRII